MKLVHTADWHLGKYLYGRSLLPDQEYFVREQFLPFLREERPDLVILAGDVFDRAIAPSGALRLFDSFLSGVSALGIPLAVIAGNHDGPDRMAIGGALLRKSGVYLAARPEEVLSPVELMCGDQPVRLFLLPYGEPAEIRAVLGNEELRTFQEAYAALLERAAALAAPDRLNLLAAHCFAAGSVTSASESPVYVGGTGEVSTACFAPFSYTALGHLHAPQRAGERGRYAGSPLKYSFDEANQEKSVTVVEFDGGEPRVSFRSFPPLRDLRVLTGSFEELLARIRVLLRKPAQTPKTCYKVADLEVHMDTQQVVRGGREVKLSGKEFALLRYMVQNEGIVLSRDRLEEHLWNFDYAGGSNVIDVYIRYLRKKLDEGHEQKLIHTVRGSGYVLKAE